MESEASRISRKMLKSKRAFKSLVRAILAHPVVEKGFGIALLTYWIIGFIGFAWGTVSLGALFISGFKSGGVADWLRDFVKAYPWLALIWLVITITTCLMFLYKEKQNNANQVEPKAQ